MTFSSWVGASDLADFIFIQSFLGNFLGFVSDQAFATKEGFATFKANKDETYGKKACLTQKFTNICDPRYGTVIFNPHITENGDILDPDKDNKIIGNLLRDGKAQPLVEFASLNDKKGRFRYNTSAYNWLVAGNPNNDRQKISNSLQNDQGKNLKGDDLNYLNEFFQSNQNVQQGGDFISPLEPVGKKDYLLNYIGSIRFIRFIITVLVDIIISTPLYIKLKEYFQSFGFDMGLGESLFNSVLQGVIGITTFYLYTNATRLDWAYTQNPSNNMTTAVGILLVCGSVGMLAMEEDPEGGIFDQLNGRMALILPGLILLSAHKIFLADLGWYKRGSNKIGLALSIIIIIMSFAGAAMFKKEDSEEEDDDDEIES